MVTGSVLYLATVGGLVSFASTVTGSLLSFFSLRTTPLSNFKISMDFALGLMLSAVAFSLVGPVASESIGTALFGKELLAFFAGASLILGLKWIIERSTHRKSISGSSQLVLALALIVHNFPEGLASGAALAGLGPQGAWSILTSIAIQNVPEGLIMVVCLRAMGWSQRKAFFGGVLSATVELLGGVVSGLAMGAVSDVLPLILMVAGGAMFTSVITEVIEKGIPGKIIKRPQFALGLLSMPFLNSLFV